MSTKYSEKLKKDLAERNLGPSGETEEKSVPSWLTGNFII